MRVFELNPIKGEKPVEWFLGTNLDIANREDALKTVDIYRRRWIVEEYFKAIKSGCKIEERQFSEIESLSKLSIFLSPMAVKLMNLRSLQALEITKTDTLSSYEWAVLERLAITNGRSLKTLADGLREISHLGGHIPSNGPPSWIVLSRGYAKLNAMAQSLSLFPELC